MNWPYFSASYPIPKAVSHAYEMVKWVWKKGYASAYRIREVLKADKDKPKSQKRPIIAIVDVKSQAYGRREETAGLFLPAAASSDIFASARMVGHPVIAFVVGHVFSGGSLTHGYQANRILALDDAGVTIHAMHEEAAARITRRSMEISECLVNKFRRAAKCGQTRMSRRCAEGLPMGGDATCTHNGNLVAVGGCGKERAQRWAGFVNPEQIAQNGFAKSITEILVRKLKARPPGFRLPSLSWDEGRAQSSRLGSGRKHWI